jgi:signal transduction histidine kinase
VTGLFNSLKFRFIASTFAWIAIGLILTGLVVSALFRAYVTQGFHDELQIHIDELAALVRVDARGDPVMLRRLSDPRYIPGGSGYYWQIERLGHRTLRSPSLAGRSLSGTLARGPKFAWGRVPGPSGETLEYGMTLAVKGGGPPLRLSIASDVRLLDDVLAEFEKPLAGLLIAFALVVLTTGAVQIGFGLRPLRRMSDAIADVRAGRTTVMQGDYPTEVAPLVSDLNDLLEVNSAIVKKARVQAGNLAHGLRTPLTIILDEAERLAAEGHADSAATLIRESERMKRQIEHHLARARAASVDRTPGQVASLRETITPVLAAMSRLHGDRDIAFCCGDFPDQPVQIDATDLAEILSNLLDNAAKWARSRVIASWEREGAMVRLLIDDDGPGIAPALYEQAFTVGEQLTDSATGSGLGLAIVRDLVELYGGTVSLGKSPLGGLQVAVRLNIAGR